MFPAPDIQKMLEHPHQWNVWAVTGFRAMLALVGEYVQVGPVPAENVLNDLKLYRDQMNQIIDIVEKRRNPTSERLTEGQR